MAIHEHMHSLSCNELLQIDIHRFQKTLFLGFNIPINLNSLIQSERDTYRDEKNCDFYPE